MSDTPEVPFDVPINMRAARIKDEHLATIGDVKEHVREVNETAADMTEKLRQKSDVGHGHGLADVATLVDALKGKAASNDPRLTDERTPTPHAEGHGLLGGDPIHPEDIGALRPPSGDGKRYLASGSGWVEYVEPDFEGEVMVLSDHARLKNRDAADSHPQSAIQHLETDLAAIDADIAALTTAVNGKAPAVHVHTTSQVEGLDNALAAKSPTVHGHIIGNITGLQSALDTLALRGGFNGSSHRNKDTTITIDRTGWYHASILGGGGGGGRGGILTSTKAVGGSGGQLGGDSTLEYTYHWRDGTTTPQILVAYGGPGGGGGGAGAGGGGGGAGYVTSEWIFAKAGDIWVFKCGLGGAGGGAETASENGGDGAMPNYTNLSSTHGRGGMRGMPGYGGRLGSAGTPPFYNFVKNSYSGGNGGTGG
ncbi:MAG: hypothetical protein LUC93_03005, partial [Planctomycetaceae bacterium]|nr:hypothetical protein [Planctomycetaceae bacterium]